PAPTRTSCRCRSATEGSGASADKRAPATDDNVSTTEETASGLGTYFAILRRRKVYVGIILPVIVLLAVYLSFALTPLYESTATILLEPSSVNPAVVASTVI